MLRDYVLELVAAPGSGATITLPGVAPAGRLTWAQGFTTSQRFVFYVLDDTTQQEWGVGALTIGGPSTIARPTVVLGNSAGTTARLNFTDTCRCYSSMPSAPMLQAIVAPVGRNYLHNASFAILQRGSGPFTTNGAVTADRWVLGQSIDAASIAGAVLSDANRTAMGDESPAFGLSNVFTSAGAAASYNVISQRIENVRRLANLTVTISFWAWAAAGAPKLGVSLDQIFGTGGSPSATVNGNGSAVTLSTTPTRYAVTLSIPSVSGKTLGSNSDHFTQLNLWYSSGSTNSARAGAVGVQSGTITLAGVQLEAGSVPTPLERLPITQDLQNCQRFYQTGTAFFTAAASAASQQMGYCLPLIVPMRAAPTIAFAGASLTNSGGLVASQITTTSFVPNVGSLAAGSSGFNTGFTASAEL